MQLGLKTICDRLCDSGYDGSQTASTKPGQPRAAAELEEVDQIAVAIMEVYGRGTNGPPQAPSGSRPNNPKRHTGRSPLTHEAKTLISDIVLEALKSFVWPDEHDLLAHKTGHGQNFLHICVTGNYRRLLRFLLDHGCGDSEKRERKDDFGRTPHELARLMERNEIGLLLSLASARAQPPPDLRTPHQIEYAYGWRFRIVLTLIPVPEHS